MQQPTQDEILTAEDVAGLLKVNVRTVYKLAREGLIPATKVGGGWRFSQKLIFARVSESSAKRPTRDLFRENEFRSHTRKPQD